MLTYWIISLFFFLSRSGLFIYLFTACGQTFILFTFFLSKIYLFIYWDRVEKEVGGEIGMGNTSISMADSCLCMTKTTTIM